MFKDDDFYKRLENIVYDVLRLPFDVICGLYDTVGFSPQRKEEDISMIVAVVKGVNRALEERKKEVSTMPLTKKGSKIMKNMKKEYGAKRGEQVFYASRNKGRISGVERKKK